MWHSRKKRTYIWSVFPKIASTLIPILLTYVWRKADYEGIANYLYNIDWYRLVYCNPSAECAWKAFVAVVWNAVDVYVPKNLV